MILVYYLLRSKGCCNCLQLNLISRYPFLYGKRYCTMKLLISNHVILMLCMNYEHCDMYKLGLDMDLRLIV